MKKILFIILKILLKIAALFLISFGVIMCLTSSLHVLTPNELVPYLFCIVLGVLLMNAEAIFDYLKQSSLPKDQQGDDLAYQSIERGLTSLFTGWVASLFGLVYGVIFIWRVIFKKAPSKGMSLAITGIIIGVICLSLGSIYFWYNPQKHAEDGYNYFITGQFDRAISEYTIALKEEPQMYGVYTERAAAYIGKGDYDSALADYTNLIESFRERHPGQDPFFMREQIDNFLNRAEVYFLKNDFDKAWEDVHEAEGLGGIPDQQFIYKLKAASNRDN